MSIIPILTNVLRFFKNHWKKVFIFLVFVFLVLFSIHYVKKVKSDLNNHFILLGDPDKVVVVESNDQNVVIVGEPDKITVKPKKR